MKHAIVTGGTSGIGLAIARGFAESGWTVTAAGLNAGAARGNNKIQGLSFHEVDVTNAEAVCSLIQDTTSLSTLVNSAGIISRHKEFNLDVFQRVLEVNLTSAMRVATAAKDKLSQTRGSVINIGSMLSFFGGGLVPAYSASKGGIAQLTKSLAIAWAADGIRVNALAPGWIETPLTAELRADPERSDSIISRTPMKRWGKPEELVGPALFLASDAASFVTGAVLTVDGGYSIG